MIRRPPRSTLFPSPPLSRSFAVPAGNATGGSHTNTVTATGTDDEGNTATDTDTQTVTYTDVAPAIQVGKGEHPSRVPATGCTVCRLQPVNKTSPAAAFDPLT